MSTKTLRKRVALATVVALGAGVLSLVSVSTANATVGNLNVAPANGATNPAAAADVLNIASSLTVTGAAVTNTGVASANDGRSVGLLAVSDLAGGLASGTTQTATLLSTGTLVVYTSTSNGSLISVTGGTIAASNATSASSDNTKIGKDGTGAVSAGFLAAQIKPNSGVTSITVSLYTANGVTGANLVSGASTGTLTGQVVVTIVASSASGTVSAANSAIYYENAGATTQNLTADSTQAGIGTSDWATTQYANVVAKDAYGVALPSGLVQVTATNGAYVKVTSSGAGTPTTTADYLTATPNNVIISVAAPSTKPVSTVVTLSYNGVTVCTKTVTIRGAAASMKIASVGTGDIGSGSTNGVGSATWIADGTGRAGLYTVTLLDSAGNIATPTAGSEFSADSTTLTTTVTALAVADASKATSVSSTSPWSYSVGTFTCGPTAGSSKVKLKYTSSATGKSFTGEFTARCADDPYTYTASFDKAAYTQGEIATLTVSFLDSKGNPANSMVTPDASTMVLPMLTFVSTTGSATTLTKADGTIAYTVTVGTSTGMTAGTYSGIVDFTSLTAVAATKATPTYKLSTGGDTTTNADVLKSIVALIASINKQIQALQKLILKR